MITISLKGHLYWYNNKISEMEIDGFSGSITDLIDHLDLPSGEIGSVIVNESRKPPEYIVKKGDSIVFLPVVGGG